MFRSSLTHLTLFTLIALLALGGCGDGAATDGGKADDGGGKNADQAKNTDKAAGKDKGKKGPKDVPPGEAVEVAFVTNNPSDFWAIARAGVEKAEKDFNAKCEFKMPADGTVDNQKRIIEELIAKGVSGMAISPNDAENQVEMINEAAERMNVICHDSDAPKSNRMAYVGTNNVNAGREAGKLIKEVLPNGGKIMLFVGRLDAQNARERKQGIEEVLRGTNIEIIDTLTDGTDRARAKANVEDTITQHPDIGCLVGLWSYNGPAILGAVKDANKQGMIPIVAFDEEPDTLQGVADGYIHATVVQDPYNFGYKSVEVLAALARGKMDIIPEDELIEIDVKVIRKANVAEFWAELKRLKSGG